MIKFIILGLIGLGVWWYWPKALPVPLASPSPTLESFANYRFAAWSVDDLTRLRLFSNLNQPAEAQKLKQKNNCRALFSAGFYDTNNQHLGWFTTGGRELSPAQANRLLDGFIAFKNGEIKIGWQKEAGVDWGLQSGPVLVYDGKPLQLTIKDDQPRRRVAAALTKDGQLIFMVILSPQSDYAGPLLAQTPKLVQALLPEAVSAINLDGGSASAFITPEVTLKEYQPIGGYFCYTEL